MKKMKYLEYGPMYSKNFLHQRSKLMCLPLPGNPPCLIFTAKARTGSTWEGSGLACKCGSESDKHLVYSTGVVILAVKSFLGLVPMKECFDVWDLFVFKNLIKIPLLDLINTFRCIIS
jgi:hypothetical protein